MLLEWTWSRSAIAEGEWWRLLSGHLLHVSVWHGLVNILGLAILWWIFRRDFRWHEWAFIALISLASVNIGLWSWTTLEWYAGASGWLHGVAAAGVLLLLRQGERWGWWLAGVGLLKIAAEFWWPAEISGTTVPVAAPAHFFGVLGGITAGCLLALVSKPSRRNQRAPRSLDG